MKKDIAIVIQNYVQYVNIKPALEILCKKYSVDIYCPVAEDDGFNNMFNDIEQILKKSNYNVYRNLQDIEYKILLEPYPVFDIKSKYKIKYRYGCISAKPNIVYHPEHFIMYDAILCAGSYDANYLSVFSKTYQTGNMKYMKFKKKQNKKSGSKKTLLYLPTYGDDCSIDDIIDEIKNLSKEYYIIAKIHHGTNFLKDETNRIEKIENIVDEFYDSHKNLSDLLEIADVVLTDNSGSIFEAIYTGIPVAVFCDDINKNKLNNFDTTQYELAYNKIIPYTNDKKEIKNILKLAMSKKYMDRQKLWNENNFYHPKNLVKDFIDIIENYFNDKVDKRYYEMHNVLKENYFNMYNSVVFQDNLIKDMKIEKENIIKDLNDVESQLNYCKSENISINKEIKKLRTELDFYKNGKLYKIAKKVYKILGRG